MTPASLVLTPRDAAIGRGAVAVPAGRILGDREGVGHFLRQIVGDGDHRILGELGRHARERRELLGRELHLIPALLGLGDRGVLTHPVGGHAAGAARDGHRVRAHRHQTAFLPEGAVLLAQIDDRGLELGRHQEAARRVDAFGLRLEEAAEAVLDAPLARDRLAFPRRRVLPSVAMMNMPER
jgi:hypothetical protein